MPKVHFLCIAQRVTANEGNRNDSTDNYYAGQYYYEDLGPAIEWYQATADFESEEAAAALDRLS